MNNDWESNDPFNSDESAGGDDPSQDMSLNMDGEVGGAFEDFSAPKKAGSTGMLVLALAVLVGGGALWAMRAAGSAEPMGVTAGEAEQQIEAALARLSGGDGSADPAETTRHALDDLFRDTDEVIALFADDPTHNQVSLEELQKNPFRLLLPGLGGGDGGSTVTTVDDTKRQRMELMARLEREHANLRLQSVITGNPSAAVIDNNVVRVGDDVGSFELIAIGPQGVRLAAEGEVFTLRLESPGGGTTLRR